jgi:hypothetical protein
MTGRTGETCQRSGPYQSGRVKVVVFFKSGQKFTNDADGGATTWTLVTA